MVTASRSAISPAACLRAAARQALLLGDRLRTNFNVDALYTSPLQRARETADILAQMVKTVAKET